MGKFSDSLTGFSGLKRRLLALAVFSIVAGCLWNGGRWVMESYATGRVSGGEASLSSNWTEGSRTKAKVVQTGDVWGNMAIQIGVSFVAAMIVGSLLRVFFRSMLVLIVIAAVTLFFLQAKGIIDPFWEDYLESADEVTDWAAKESKTLWRLMTEVVPSTGAAVLGLIMGLKR